MTDLTTARSRELMSRSMRHALRATCLLTLAAVAGCVAATEDGGIGVVQNVTQAASSKYKVSSRLKDQPPRLVAVIPFVNLTGNTAEEEEKGAEYVIRTAFINRFTTRR